MQVKTRIVSVLAIALIVSFASDAAQPLGVFRALGRAEMPATRVPPVDP